MANEFKVKHGLIVNGSGSTVLDVQGSQGQLFSITDSLSGSLFSVGDISGIPILEVFSDDTVKIGSYNNEAIVVSGSHATVSGSFSGSFIGDGSGLTGISIAGIFSSSAQVDHDQTTNFSADEHFTQANITTVGTVTSGDVSGILPAGTVSGSDQLDGFVSKSGDFVANELIVATGTSSVTSSNILSLDTTNNYLGINQTSPEVTLHMTGDGAQTAQIRMEQFNDTTDAPDIRTRKARGTSASPSAPAAGDYLFRQNIERYNGSGYSTMHSQQFDLDSSDATKAVYQLQTDIGSGLITRYSIDASSVHSFTGNVKVAGTISGSSSITGSDVKIDDWGSVSASLATISASAAAGGTTPTLQEVTDQGATTTNDITITGSINVTGSIDVHQTQDNTGIVIHSSDVQPEIIFKDDSTGDTFSIGHNRASSRMDIEIDGIDTHTFTVDGNVGIGTTSPTYRLQVAGADGSLPLLSLKNTGSAQTEDVIMSFNRDNSDTLGFAMGIDSQDNSFKIANDGDSINSNARLTIDSNGDVGIGTTSPSQKLTVAGNITQTSNSYLISTRKITARDSNGLSLYNDGGAGIDIKDSGNVGIGTTSPVDKLHVDGNVTASAFYGDGTNLTNVQRVPKVEYLSLTASIASNDVETLPNSLSYTTSSDGYEYLEVFLDGIRLNRTFEYSEVNTTQVRYLLNIPSGSMITYKSLTLV